MNRPVEDTKPWYKQFWPWFIIAFPASAVIAGIATVIIATVNQDAMVEEDYYKEGMAINESIGRQQVAESMDLGIALSYGDKKHTELVLNQPLDERVLYVEMRHPVDDKKDRVLVLVNSGDNLIFKGEIVELAAVNYRINIHPADKKWEVLARWHPIEQASKKIQAQ